MKQWLLRLSVTVGLILGLLFIIVVSPVLMYAHKTGHAQYTILHNAQLPQSFTKRLDEATMLVQQSELYDLGLKLEVCLNDGSPYPALIDAIKGPAFAHGFDDKIVLLGKMDASKNHVELNGYRWNLTQLLAHEATHCYQFGAFGFRHSNPVARHPEWKWEGYPEYVARRGAMGDLSESIAHLLAVEQTAHNNWISFEDSTGTVIAYYKSWLLMQYCLDIRGMNYTQVLADTTTEEQVYAAMIKWYGAQ